MRALLCISLTLLTCACGPAEVSVEEAGRATGDGRDLDLAPHPAVAVDLGDGLMLAVVERGAGAFVRAGGRLRVHYSAKVISVAALEVIEAPAQPATTEIAPEETIESESAAAAEPAEAQVEVIVEPVAVAVDEPVSEAPAQADETLQTPVELPVFDSSWARGMPDVWDISNTAHPRLIEGLRRGLVGLTAGSRLTLTIPAALAWGDEGLPAAGVPAHADVSYEIEIIEVLP